MALAINYAKPAPPKPSHPLSIAAWPQALLRALYRRLKLPSVAATTRAAGHCLCAAGLRVFSKSAIKVATQCSSLTKIAAFVITNMLSSNLN
jgi:hypothetical protein